MTVLSSERTSMDWSLKPCITTTILLDVHSHNVSLQVDRLTSLPDELLIRILSLLRTKYAVATCVLSKRMRRVFRWVTILDFNDFPISHCLKYPYAIERFPTFVNFVDTVLHAHEYQCLTRFRLRVGADFYTRYYRRCRRNDCGCYNGCFPELKSTQINAWISIPLSRRGLRELDICIHVREPGDAQLPPEIFTCEMLEVLKLDVNLSLDRVSTLPSFRLPNLKLFHLSASFLSGGDFVTRLVSSCPLLEDLIVEAWWNHRHLISISSTSLLRLCLKVREYEDTNPDYVLINTPNLEYLLYYDNLALEYNIQKMHNLVKADLLFGHDLLNKDMTVSGQLMLDLIRTLSNVQQLSLRDSWTQDLNFVEVKDQLPMLPNLKYLDLGCSMFTYWDNALLAFLNCSPVLETLAFPEGIIADWDDITPGDRRREPIELERRFCRTSQAIPLCCRSHLKRIVIKYYFGKEREVYLTQFLLRHALVLEELIIISTTSGYPASDLESTLKSLPRASVTCSIQVQ